MHNVSPVLKKFCFYYNTKQPVR